MKVECSVKELELAVNHAMRAIPSKTGNVLENLFVSANDAGIEVAGSDGSFTIIDHVNGSVSEGGSVLVPARLLYDLLRTMTPGMLQISVNENYQITLKSSGLRHSIVGMDASEYPDVGEFEISGSLMVQLPQARLSSMIGHVMFAVANDDTHQILNGCLLEVEKDEMRVVCLDGFRLALQVYHGEIAIPEGSERITAIVPGKIMNEISRLLGSDGEAISTFCIGGGHMSVTIGSTRIMCTLLAGDFINYRQILPKSWVTRITVRRAELLGACERAGVIAAPGRNSLIRFKTTNNSLVITANSEYGNAYEEVECAVDGKPGEIALNSRYIAEVLKNVEDENCLLNMNDSISPCVIAPCESDEYLFLVLPIRVAN